MDTPASVEKGEPVSTKLPRCRRGTRRNRKTGDCEKTSDKKHTPRLKIVDILPEQSDPVSTKKLPRCQRGTRRNRKTGDCEKTSDKKHTPRLRIVDVLPEQPETIKIKMPKRRRNQKRAETVEEIDREEIDREEIDREERDREEIEHEENEYPYLYPTLDDPLFNKKIAERQEFYDTRYVAQQGDVRIIGDKLCNAEFELAPHQMFVRNFMSFQTPYNSLILYHGLGSGKTCSAISVAEEMRDYMNQMGISQRIIVIASPNVQENFKLQLFDDRKLEQIDGLWNIRACTGNKFLKEINPMNMKGLSRERIIIQVKRIINAAYLFMGYIEFANYVEKKSAITSDIPESKRAILVRTKLRKHFGNRLVIIDEVHNIRMTEDNKDKRVAVELEKLVNNVPDLRLLFLSATPMYNSYKESIWLINLMNKNDGRSTIEVKDVFESDGSFRVDSDGVEVGRELLMRKATGYVSFMRGDNPYTFPYRIWPTEFAPLHTFAHNERPTQQLNGTPIVQDLEIVSVYLTPVGDIQQWGYDTIIASLRAGEFGHSGHTMPSFENMESFGYTMLQRPLEALNIVYPVLGELPEPGQRGDLEIKDLVGKGGLDRVVSYTESVSPPQKYDYEYRAGVPHMFSPQNIGKYSGKIKNICDSIVNSEGVVLVYSQYLDGGVVPIALALEELGLVRAGSGKSLFKTRPRNDVREGLTVPTSWRHTALGWENLNQHLQNLTERKEINEDTSYDEVMRKLSEVHAFSIPSGERGREARQQTESLVRIAIRNATTVMRYVVITGDKALSPDNVTDLKAVTDVGNKNGDKVKVVIISQAGSEGLDFKFIRQVHVMEPWYNMNRIEQIIGRAVRTCSHKSLPFDERNVEIYLHGSLMENREEEAADIYVYRLAEVKALQIGHVSRALKEVAVDCILNSEQMGFTADEMDQTVEQKLSTGEIISYPVGDKPFSSMCDYMERCSYSCKPTPCIDEKDVTLDTYEESFILMNTDKIMQRVRELMKDRYFYRKVDLLKELTVLKNYPLVQIDAALTQLVEDKNEYISDRYGRMGHLINIADLYLFQPLEINNEHISIYDRSVPLEWKREGLIVNLPDAVSESIVSQPSVRSRTTISHNVQRTIDDMKAKYEIATTPQSIKRGEENWYKFCSVAIDHMVETGIPRDTLNQLVIEHIVDELSFEAAFSLMNELTMGSSSESDFKSKVLEYMTRDSMTAKGLTGLLMDKTGSQQLVVRRDKSSEWAPAEPEDYQDLVDELARFVSRFAPLSERMNPMMGFMTDFKKEFIVFKTKDLSKKRTQGARCDQATKVSGVKIMNKILGESRYATSTPISKRQLCVMQEFTLRLYNQEKKHDKLWFLTPIQATITNIEKAKL